jgi:glycosyltransferase involved in cell wall biosynthesis
MLVVSLVTCGSPAQLTGGHLYHRRMAEEGAARGARVEFVQVGAFRNPLRRTEGVVLVDSLVAWRAAPWVMGRSPSRPIAAVVHQSPGGVDHSSARTRIQTHLDRALYERCAVLIAASELLAEELTTAHGLPAEHVHVIEPGCDVPVRAESLPGLRHGRRIALLSVANWLPNKGVVDLLAAVAALPDDHVTLHLVGRDDLDGEYAKQIRDRLRSPDLADRVVVHGAVPHERIGSLYAAADAFALMSHREAYGMAFAEALAAGLPTVGWRSGNLRHLIEDGREGLLLPPGDSRGLTAVLRRLSTDDEWRRQLSAAAAERGRQLPTWGQSADKFFTVLAQLSAR